MIKKKTKAKSALPPRFVTTSINFDAKVVAKAKEIVEAPGSQFRSVSALTNYYLARALGLAA